MKPTARLVALLASLTAFVPFSIDTYLPSLPQIAVDLSSSTAQVQHTISAFLAGLCLGMLFYGPLSDRYGRRPLLLGSLVLYGLATLGCLFAGSPGDFYRRWVGPAHWCWLGPWPEICLAWHRRPR